MTELLTSAQMRAIETAAIEAGAVTGLALMERAGQGVVEAVFQWQPTLAEGAHRAAILCGPGNNGGDGYVIARLLCARGWDVTVFALARPKTPDAAANAARWKGPTQALDQFRRAPAGDLYVDALFGTGLTRAPDGEVAQVLRHLGGYGGDHGHLHPRLVAVDAPSGLCLDSGRVLAGGAPSPGLSQVPLAGLTVTFECPKLGHFLGDGPAVCGKLEVVDLGLSDWRAREAACSIPQARNRLIDTKAWAAPCANDVAPSLGVHKAQGHKYTHGHGLVVAGDMGRTGAARLAARAALRVGAGAVTVAAPGAAMIECATQLTAVMLRKCDTAEELTRLVSETKATALCIGPGLGLIPVHGTMVAAALETGLPCVLDADALTLLAGDDTLRRRLHVQCVLTPHMGEFRRLCPDLADVLIHPIELQGKGASRSFTEATPETFSQFAEGMTTEPAVLRGPAPSKVDVTRAAAERFGCTVLLKGPDTVIAHPDGRVAVHAAAYDRAVPWLATAGAGDVLAGLITGLLAQQGQSLLPMAAAEQAAWIHAQAACAFGPGLIAEDLPDLVPQVLKELLASEGP